MKFLRLNSMREQLSRVVQNLFEIFFQNNIKDKIIYQRIPAAWMQKVYTPRQRFVISIRDPVERTLSEYFFHHKKVHIIIIILIILKVLALSGLYDTFT